MSTPRERVLAMGLKNKLIGIQKSDQINAELSKWQKKVLLLDDKGMTRVANSIAAKIEKSAAKVEKKTGNEPTPEQIKAWVKKELERI